MQKGNSTLIGIIIATVVLVGGFFFFKSQTTPKQTTPDEKPAMIKKDASEAMMGKGFVMKDGKMMVEENGKMTAMTADSAINDGTKVTTSGQVMKKDGTTMTLTEGQSIWMDGTFDAGSMKKDEGTMKKTGDKMMSDSRYVEYSKAALDKAAKDRRVLYFYANWCPICRPADADFRANSSKIPADVTVIRVNYNDTDTDQEEKDLAKKYAITYQHTFVQIDGQGKEVTKWNGGQTDDLLAKIK